MFRPCYNLAWFHGIVSIVLNDEMADILADAINQHQTKSDLLQAVAAELTGEEPKIEIEESLIEPSYDYAYYFGKTTLTLNRAAASQIAAAVLDTQERINGALYALGRELDHFARFEKNEKEAA